MSKYSIQNECLEMIEAFTYEQFESEMAVIESVLDIFDKSVLMMELSGSTANVPDCSMFMESTFFQEADPIPSAQQQQPAPQQPAATPATNQTANKNAAPTAATEEERKEYNKEHHFRKMNSKGKIENIFISILLFIPRLLFLPIKLLYNFIKKKKDEKAATTVKNATPEEKAAVANELKTKEGTEEDGVKIENNQMIVSTQDGTVWAAMPTDGSGIITNIDEEAITSALSQTFTQIQQNLTPDKLESDTPIVTIDIQTQQQKVESAKKRRAEAKAIIDLETRERQRDATLKSLRQQLAELNRCKKTIDIAITRIQSKLNAATNPNDQNVFAKRIEARKKDLNMIQSAIKTTTKWIQEYEAADSLTDKLINKYAGYLEKNKQNVANASTASGNALNAADAGTREKV